MQGTVNRYMTWFGHWAGLIYVWIRGSSRLLIGKGGWGAGWYCKRNFLQTLESQRLASLHWGHLDPPLISNSLSTQQKKIDASNNNSEVHVHVLHFKVQIAPNYQCCQLHWIIRETPDFGPYLLVSRLEYEISQIIPDVCHFFSRLSDNKISNSQALCSHTEFQIFCFVWAILMLTLNVSLYTPTCHCNNNVIGKK